MEAATRYRQLTGTYQGGGQMPETAAQERLVREYKHHYELAVSRGNVVPMIEGLEINELQSVGVSADLVAARRHVIMEMQRWDAIAGKSWEWWHSELSKIMRLERRRKP